VAKPEWVADEEHVEGARAALEDGDMAALKKLGVKVHNVGRAARKCMRSCRRRTETTNYGASICFGCGIVYTVHGWPATDPTE